MESLAPSALLRLQGLSLSVVMDLGEYEIGEEKIDASSNHNPCIVSVGWVPQFWQKVDLKVEICD